MPSVKRSSNVPSLAGRRRKATGRVRFAKTNEFDAVVRAMVKSYYAERNVVLSKKELRKAKSRVFVAIERGTAHIPMQKVVVR